MTIAKLIAKKTDVSSPEDAYWHGGNPDISNGLDGRRDLDIDSELEESLRLLIERDNPMADAAKRALRRL